MCSTTPLNSQHKLSNNTNKTKIHPAVDSPWIAIKQITFKYLRELFDVWQRQKKQIRTRSWSSWGKIWAGEKREGLSHQQVWIQFWGREASGVWGVHLSLHKFAVSTLQPNRHRRLWRCTPSRSTSPSASAPLPSPVMPPTTMLRPF